MRLEKIKLAGFKSFVDPTTVPLPSNLVGVVGPNGCGKSNVIDAVRWVMGESSAKMLRGESMADVIFNGSSTRKPVGTATIELLFDNSDGSAGGQYAQYSEISVKRQVARDGQSSYFLNGVRCRRRDITDLFLGTGLGPRSYSIIEQGMISRLIEARPEDLRMFLEEAAGISKYKERRRETENRIGHTRENLARLDDLRDEVAKQLHHLQRQAATAERYQRLKQEERQAKAEVLALRWQTLDGELKSQERRLLEHQTGLEAEVSRQRRLEAEIEHERELHQQANDRFNKVQGGYFAVGAEISRLEQSIQFARDGLQQQKQELEQAEKAWREMREHQDHDQVRLQELQTTLAKELPELEQAQTAEGLAAEQLQEADRAMHAWQTAWDQFNHEAAEPAQTAQVERTRINHLEKQEQDLQRRLQRLGEELERLADGGLGDQIVDLQQQEAAAALRAEQAQERLSVVLAGVRETRDQMASRSDELDRVRAELQVAKGRVGSIEALQQAALGMDQGAVAQWLRAQDLDHAARLAQRLEVEPHWQQAVESVLGFHLESVCVDDLESAERSAEDLDEGALGLFGAHGQSIRAEDSNALAAHVRGPAALQGLLQGVFVAADLEEAIALRPQLGSGQSVVTPRGVWLGPGWMRLVRGEDTHAGVLAREQELRELATRTEVLHESAEVLAAGLESDRAQLQAQEEERERVQASLNEINRELAELRSQLSAKRTRAEHLQTRREHVAHEQHELHLQLEQDREQMERARARLHDALERMETLAERRAELVAQRDELRQQLNSLRDQAAQRRALAHQLALHVESMTSSQTSLIEGRERMAGQLEHLEQRCTELREGIANGAAPLERLGVSLEAELTRRVAVEAELGGVRTTLEGIDGKLRDLEQGRHQAEQAVQQARGVLDAERIRRQEILVRAKTVEEQLQESGHSIDDLLAHLGSEAEEAEWQQRLEKLGLRIQRLGPINLAAIDEFQEQSKRMEYLDAQHADISESLETLEGAIRKIDRETRSRFKEVFDKVNSGLQELFPRLFGGGHAYLELTGEDLLDTGVAVMARPPGKRNSNIHMLSGGEKALTAVALVFAIFQLNPAPFCMLDEVDAPLDDANVSRYCDLVRSMSKKVQFIFITHNKVTMEIANQLTGVTMHEPGVSRLVSVDVEEAAQLAAV